eukprot:364935-Chlamydomonas_euryale.AAC.8
MDAVNSRAWLLLNAAMAGEADGACADTANSRAWRRAACSGRADVALLLLLGQAVQGEDRRTRAGAGVGSALVCAAQNGCADMVPLDPGVMDEERVFCVCVSVLRCGLRGHVYVYGAYDAYVYDVYDIYVYVNLYAYLHPPTSPHGPSESGTQVSEPSWCPRGAPSAGRRRRFGGGGGGCRPPSIAGGELDWSGHV